MSYKPYRILKRIVVVVNDGDDTAACYPHGKLGKRMIATGKVPIVFDKGVIDAPTDEEIAVFSLPALKGSAKHIPQDPRGFDSRTSGVARSIKGSQRGREAGIIEKHERDFAKADAAKKPKPEVVPEFMAKPEIVPGPVPKLEPEIEAEPLIENLEYLNPVAKVSLANANITKISHLRGRTAKELDELPGIGVKLAERLLADHEAYLKMSEPIADEIKEEGDKE